MSDKIVVQTEYGVSQEMIDSLIKLFPRRMYVSGMSIEDFAINAGEYHVILHLQKVLNNQKRRGGQNGKG